ncbi:MAG: hypothetical protein U5R48_12285 [Gammaproteobacteria bacterium]|nr:hypothetical protein [Gammaproteobacteria bacterium]
MAFFAALHALERPLVHKQLGVGFDDAHEAGFLAALGDSDRDLFALFGGEEFFERHGVTGGGGAWGRAKNSTSSGKKVALV